MRRTLIVLSCFAATPLVAEPVKLSSDAIKITIAGSRLELDTPLGMTVSVRFNRDGFAVTLPGGALFKLHDPASTAALTRCLQVTLVGALSTMPAGGGCT